MTHSELIEKAKRVLDYQPWNTPGTCYDLAKSLRAAGESEWAERLEQAAHSPPTWFGASVR